MSRKVLMNRLAEELNKPVSEIQNMKLTNNQMYWMIQHEKMHKRASVFYRLSHAYTDCTLNSELLK